uniref:Uncharacterized protein n=1 Tax=Avena sativa TaxID=4498 RepID=A0ACD5WW35_AVESA
MHYIGESMLPEHIVKTLTPDMRSLHEFILYAERALLKDKNPSYPVFTVRVPTNCGFVTTSPTDLFFIRYEDVFRLFHMFRLERNLVRLISLSMAHDIIVEKTPHIAIMDPFNMTAHNNEKEQAFVARHKYCVLIIFQPYYSNVVYLDFGRDVVQKDYTDVKSTLDKALNGFRTTVGPLKYEKKVKGCYVCSHITNFPCLKQSSGGTDAWFTVLQMREFVKDQELLLMPSGLEKRGIDMANTTDANIRAEFRAIQRKIGTVLMRDVLKRGALFNYNGIPLSKAEIETRLEACFDVRTFRTLDGIHPFPPNAYDGSRGPCIESR